ncbi:hypothetical protein [Pseudomonas sp. P1.8]|uniref:hypothetical protein n=1 Tax=Pseudomonas sp. P1.8 TaxID=1699310 RepID=UPI00069DE101|nr:hypothetical protein [Pseudomonas sp. P1.8]
MTKANGVDVEAYIKGEMVLHFSHITLTQRRTDDPMVFFGPGQVHLDKGQLKYVVYHTSTSDEANRHMAMSFSGQAGELVKEHSLFDFEGVDVAGKIWAAKGVDTSGGDYRSDFCVVGGTIGFLSSRHACSGSRKSTLHQVYFDDPHFPSPRLSIAPSLEFVCGESTVTITKDESGCDVTVLNGELSDGFAKAVEKALNVLSGVRLQLGVAEKVWEGHSTVELYSRDIELSNQQLFPPVEIPFRCASDFFGAIFNLLVGFFEQDGAVFYDNWNKLNRAWQAGLESTALNVSVCIEGVLKAYFEALGTDGDFAELSKRAVPAVMRLDIDERVKSLLRSCLGGSGNFKPKTALRALTQSGEISPELAGKWNKLRSETAHAVVASEAREDWQRMVDLTFANIKLFYEILFSIVGYTGERIDYESRGFPSRLPSARICEMDQAEE